MEFVSSTPLPKLPSMQNYRGNQRCDRTAAAPSSSLKLAAVAWMHLWLICFCVRHLDNYFQSGCLELHSQLLVLKTCRLQDYQHLKLSEGTMVQIQSPCVVGAS